MKLADLPPDVIERIKTLRYDRIIEKHEGPEDWSRQLKPGRADLLTIGGRYVLLPVPASNHRNIAMLREIVSDAGDSLTLFLKDTTFAPDPEWERYFTGFIAICDRLRGTEIFVAMVYHEWFLSAGWRLT